MEQHLTLYLSRISLFASHSSGRRPGRLCGLFKQLWNVLFDMDNDWTVRLFSFCLGFRHYIRMNIIRELLVFVFKWVYINIHWLIKLVELAFESSAYLSLWAVIDFEKLLRNMHVEKRLSINKDTLNFRDSWGVGEKVGLCWHISNTSILPMLNITRTQNCTSNSLRIHQLHETKRLSAAFQTALMC